MSELTGKKAILIILRRCEGKNNLMGVTRIQKLAFLLTLEDELRYLNNELKYDAHYYGPYSETITNGLEILSDNNFIESNTIQFEKLNQNRADERVIEDHMEIKEYIQTKDYKLTEAGRLIADYYFKKLDDNEKKLINSITDEYGQLELIELLKKVYKIAPDDLLRNSTIKDDLGI